MLIAISVGIAACSDEAKDEKGNSESGESSTGDDVESSGDELKVVEYTLDTAMSVVNWSIAERGEEEEGHEGAIAFRSGSLSATENELVSGKVVANLHSTVITDLMDNQKRHDHLKEHFFEEDFFAEDSSTLNDPIIELISFDGETLRAAMTVRGIRAEVELPATIERSDKWLLVKSEDFFIDFLPFNIPFFAQDKEEEGGHHQTIVDPVMRFESLHLKFIPVAE